MDGFSWSECYSDDKEATERRKLVRKWHPTTKGTLKRNYRVPSKAEGHRLLKAIASLLSDDDHFVDATSHKVIQSYGSIHTLPNSFSLCSYLKKWIQNLKDSLPLVSFFSHSSLPLCVFFSKPLIQDWCYHILLNSICFAHLGLSDTKRECPWRKCMLQ